MTLCYSQSSQWMFPSIFSQNQGGGGNRGFGGFPMKFPMFGNMFGTSDLCGCDCHQNIQNDQNDQDIQDDQEDQDVQISQPFECPPCAPCAPCEPNTAFGSYASVGQVAPEQQREQNQYSQQAESPQRVQPFQQSTYGSYASIGQAAPVVQAKPREQIKHSQQVESPQQSPIQVTNYQQAAPPFQNVAYTRQYTSLNPYGSFDPSSQPPSPSIQLQNIPQYTIQNMLDTSGRSGDAEIVDLINQGRSGSAYKEDYQSGTYTIYEISQHEDGKTLKITKKEVENGKLKRSADIPPKIDANGVYDVYDIMKNESYVLALASE